MKLTAPGWAGNIFIYFSEGAMDDPFPIGMHPT